MKEVIYQNITRKYEEQRSQEPNEKKWKIGLFLMFNPYVYDPLSYRSAMQHFNSVELIIRYSLEHNCFQ
jgi:hypothetical protein